MSEAPAMTLNEVAPFSDKVRSASYSCFFGTALVSESANPVIYQLEHLP
ncbi:MAG: hypothetical protein KC422_16355 [Trueperaceae bacterium]|nr:hypothetical protein [Trueperaceae bacterium]